MSKLREWVVMMARQPTGARESSLVGDLFSLVWALVRLVFRFLFGMPLTGRQLTDATFFTDGQTDLREGRSFFAVGGLSRWSYWAGYKRAGVRWAVVGTLVAVYLWPVQSLIVGSCLGAVALGLALWRIVVYIRKVRGEAAERVHRAQYVDPLALALARPLGIDPDRDPAEWVTVPIDFKDEDADPIRIELPADYVHDAKRDRAITDAAASKLGLSPSDLSWSWHMVGASPWVEARPTVHPPDIVVFEEVRDLVAQAVESAPVIGVTARYKPVVVDLDAESPHILVSMSTGAGKSVLAMGIAAQVLHNGGEVVIIDIKRHSHRWARGLAGVRYVRDIEDIHDTLIALENEGSRRNVLAEDDESASDSFVRTLVIAEEMNATMAKLRGYWMKIRTKDDPKSSPAIDAWSELLYMGRAVKLNILAIAQMGSARTMGGPEARECFASRVLGRYTQNAWRMLAPEIWPMPKASKRRGRVQVVLAGEAQETQVILWSPDEAQAWAEGRDGSQRPKLHLVPASEGPELVEVPGTDELGPVEDGPRAIEAVADTTPIWPRYGDSAADLDDPGEIEPEPAPARPDDGPAGADPWAPADPTVPELVSLREAAELGVVVLSDTPAKTLEILRAARKRDVEFPVAADRAGRGGADLYAPEELRRWARNRPNSRSAG